MNLEYIIFYTTAIGGVMQPTWGDPERYEELKRKGTIQLHPELDQAPPEVPLKMVGLARVDEVYDFVLGRSR